MVFFLLFIQVSYTKMFLAENFRALQDFISSALLQKNKIILDMPWGS